MIRYERKDNAVQVMTEVFIPGAGLYTYATTYSAGDDVHAQLLVNQLNKSMGDKLAEIRHEAYDAGWKAAKAKGERQVAWFKRMWS